MRPWLRPSPINGSSPAPTTGSTWTAILRDLPEHRTMLAAGTRGGESGACREAYGTEWARLMVYLAAMQGWGKPGVNIWGTTMGAPFNPAPDFPGYNPG